MENFIGLVAVVLIFGLPIITILCVAYAYIKKRQWAHQERLKMIENGLISSEEDIQRMEKALDSSRPFDWSALFFYPLVFYQVMLLMGYVVFILFYMVLIKTGVNNGHFLVWTLLGMMATGVLTVVARVLPVLRRYRGLILLGALFLSLMWTVLFVRQLTSVSIEQVKSKVKTHFLPKWNISAGDDTLHTADDTGAIKLEIRDGTGKGKVIVR